MKLLENNNRKFIKTLSDNCLKANKRRNIIAILAIILTAVLFMALTTVYEGAQISMRNQMFRQAGTKFMVSIKNLTRKEAEKLVSNTEFAVAGMERYFAYVVNPELKDIDVLAGWVDETVAKNSFMELEEGHYPEEENEIACDAYVLELLGLPYKTGTTFTLKYIAEEDILEKEMTVCGIWEGMRYESTASVLVSEAFIENSIKEMTNIYASAMEHGYNIRGSFFSEKNISEKLDKIVEGLGYNPDAERGEEGFLIHHISSVYEVKSQDSLQTLLLSGVGIIFILLAGYLIIYNIFRISIEKDIRLYGQLKTIGTSPKQIKYMVTRQGMVLSAVGIPAGLIFGWLLGNLLLPLVMSNTSYNEVYFIVPSVWIWIISAFFALITVRISCDRPGRIAGKISPIEALKYHGMQKCKKSHKKGKTSHNRIMSMAVSNLGRNKGRTVLVVFSISLSVMLLNSVLNYTGNMDKEVYVRRNAITDFNVRSASFLKYSGDSYNMTVPKDMAESIRNIDGIKDYGEVYCYMLPEEELTEDMEDLGKIIKINDKDNTDAIKKFGRDIMIYGYDENALKQTEIIEGDIDYKKLCTGNYVIMEGFLDDRGKYLYDAQMFHAGDVIKVQIGEKIYDYTVMAVVGGNSVSLNMSYSKGVYEAIVFAKSVFFEMFKENVNPIHCLFNAKEEKFEDINHKLSAMAESGGLSVASRLSEEEEFKEMYNTYNMIGITISLIFGGIGILNLINIILTGVIARQSEFISMRSIGMTKRQLRKMIVYEGIIYAILAGVSGVLLSGILSVTLIKKLSENTWYLRYHFTVVPAIVIFGICILLSALISAMTDKMWNKGSITEQLGMF